MGQGHMGRGEMEAKAVKDYPVVLSSHLPGRLYQDACREQSLVWRAEGEKTEISGRQSRFVRQS